MRSIREIGILVEQLNATIGSTQQILQGIDSDPTTAKGSLEYVMDFNTRMQKIRGLYANPKEQTSSPFTTPPDEIANKFVGMVNEFIELKKQNDQNLKNWHIPLNDAPMLKTVAQQLFNDSALTDLDFDKIKKIRDSAKDNEQPFANGTHGGILNEDIILKQSCASGTNDCAGPQEGMGLIQAIETYIKQQIVCTLKVIPQLIGSSLLKPLVKWADMVRKIDTKWEQLLQLAFLGAIPVIGPQYLLPIGIAMISDAVFMKLAGWYCSWSKQCGNTYDDDYKNICITNAHRATLYRFQINTTIFNDNTLQPDTNTYWIMQEGINELSNLTTSNFRKTLDAIDASLTFNILITFPISEDDIIIGYEYLPITCSGTGTSDPYNGQISLKDITFISKTTYNPFEKYPEIKSHALFDDDNHQRDEEIYDVVLDGIAVHYITVNEPNTALCVQNTQTANTLILYRMVDMMLNPSKYGLQDPADVIVFGSIGQNYDIIKAIGEFLKGSTGGQKVEQFGNDANQIITDSLVNLYSAFDEQYNDSQEYLRQKIASASGIPSEIAWKSMDTLHESASPILFAMMDVLQETYSLYKELTSKDRMVEVFCCLLGELINLAVEWLLARGITVSIETILERIKATLDMLINILRLIMRLLSSDLMQMFSILFGQVTGGTLALVVNALQLLYNAILTTIDKWITSLNFNPEGLTSCLPWDILIGFIKKLIYIAMRRFMQMFTIFIGKIQDMINLNYSITGKIAMVQAITFYISMLENLKMNLTDFIDCVRIAPTGEAISSNFITPEDSEIHINNDGTPFIKKDEDNQNQTYTGAYGIIYMSRASKASGMSIYIDKEKFSYFLDKIALADPVATLNYVKGRNINETFEERRCTSSKTMTLKEILDYYQERI